MIARLAKRLPRLLGLRRSLPPYGGPEELPCDGRGSAAGAGDSMDGHSSQSAVGRSALSQPPHRRIQPCQTTALLIEAVCLRRAGAGTQEVNESNEST
jgi:hypothetical protein